MFPAILGGLGLLGSIFGGGAKSAAQGRATEADLQSRQDAARTSQYGIGQNAQMNLGSLDLQRKQFGEQARGGRAQQALLADLLGNFKPGQVSVPGIQNAQMSGGLQAGIGSEGSKAAMAELYKQAMAKQLEGDTFEGGQMLKAPGVTALPQPSGWEKIAGILGSVGSIAGGIGQALPQQGGGTPPYVPDGAAPSANLKDILKQIEGLS